MAVTRLGLAGLALAAATGVLVASAAPAVGESAGGFQFVRFELPATPPAPVGTVCPRRRGACSNNAVEPQIRAAPDGTFYAASENTLFKGTIAARSRDGGRHYTSLPSPNITSSGSEFAPGGGDVDVATATAKNGAGFYNVYVASLSLANVTVSTSTNGGASWRANVTSAIVPGDDREWIAADGTSKVCISYHDLPTFNINVDCSFDAGATFTQHALPGAIDLTHVFLLQNNQTGNLAIDPASHVIYMPITGVAGVPDILCGILGTCRYYAVWMAVSTDGGRTFADHLVYAGSSPQLSYNHQFPVVTVDRAGNVYVVFSDDHGVFYTVSSDHGRTWTTPAQVSSSPARTAIFPWAVAGDAGKLDVVYYGTSYANGTTPPDRFPTSAAWHVYFAQNLHATDRGSSFTQVEVTPVVHYGAVCEGGVGCTGNRDLFDDFGVAASPKTGLASIAYTDDQYVPQPGCTRDRSNTFECDHTNIATQVSGGRIFGPAR